MTSSQTLRLKNMAFNGLTLFVVIFFIRSSSATEELDFYDFLDKYAKQETNVAAVQQEATTTPSLNDVEGCGNHMKCVLEAICKKGQTHDNAENKVADAHSNRSRIKCSNMKICCHVDDMIATEAPILSAICGYTNNNGVGIRISNVTNTNQAKFGEFPWMIALMTITENAAYETITYIGGGALIAPNIVLTANHIVTNETLLARAGEWHTRFTNETYAHQDRFVETIIYHESYNNYTFSHNIAMLILKVPFTLEPHINPICLPSSVQQPFQDERCLMSGWGKLSPGDASYQPILKKLSLPIVLHEECDSMLRNTSLGSSFRLHQSFLCAGGEEGLDACTGDGGSPLVCPIVGTPNRYYLAGIVAMGLECGKKDVPGIYTNVTHFRKWIDERLKLQFVKASYFTA